MKNLTITTATNEQALIADQVANDLNNVVTKLTAFGHEKDTLLSYDAKQAEDKVTSLEIYARILSGKLKEEAKEQIRLFKSLYFCRLAKSSNVVAYA